MKKLIILLLLSIVGTVTYAQNSASLIKGPTTLTNAATDSVRVNIKGGANAVTFKYDISKTSGTVAGTVVLKGRVVHSTLGTSAEQWAVINTYTLTDATATNSVLLTGVNYSDYLVLTTTTGTQVSVHRKYLLVSKY
jgi:hypothetical protein